MKLLENKNIIVTGTARGMGKEMIKIFAENGANILAFARTSNDDHNNYCVELSNKYNVNVEPYYFDLTDFEQIKSIIKTIMSKRIKIDGLVNNAGISNNALFQMTPIEDVKKIFEVNFFAPYLLTQYISKIMVRNGGGSIVSISSTSALDCNSGKTAYGSSKAAIMCMTKCISRELAEKGVRANVICPGVINTEMIGMLPEYVLDIQKEASALKTIGNPSDVANVALFLLSDNSSYITGEIIRVDGGVTQFSKRQ